MTPLMNEESEVGWNHLVNDVHGMFRKRDEKKLIDKVIGKPPEEVETKKRTIDRRFLLEIFIISVISAFGLSLGYLIFNFLKEMFV